MNTSIYGQRLNSIDQIRNMRTTGADQIPLDDGPIGDGTVADATHPASDNPYLASILIPKRFSSVIPDGSQVPSVMRSYDISSVLQWVSANYNMLICVFEGSPRNLVVVLLQPVNESVWYYLTSLTLDQPLSTNYRLCRLCSSQVDIKSASQAAGVFALSGLINSVRAVSMPPLSGLTFNSVVSYATNGGYVVKGATAESGITTLFPGKTDTEFWPPEDGNLVNMQEVTSFQSSYPKNAWNGVIVMGGVANANYQIMELSNFVQFPDPCWGRMRINGHLQFSCGVAIAANDCQISIGSNVRVADQVTWACTNASQQWFQTYLPAAAANTSILINFDFTCSSDAPMTGLQIVFNNGSVAPVAKTITLLHSENVQVLSSNYLGLTLFDTERDQLFGNPSLTILEQVSVGQPVSIAGSFNYQLVPNANLSRNISPVPIPSDLIYKDMANAVLARIGRGGPPMVWEGKHYAKAVNSGYFSQFIKQSFAYAAAPPALAATLAGLWSKVSPSVLRALRRGGKAALNSFSQHAIEELPDEYRDVARRVAQSGGFMAAPADSGGSQSIELQEESAEAPDTWVFYAASARWESDYKKKTAPELPKIASTPVKLSSKAAWRVFSESEEGHATAQTFGEFLSSKPITQQTRLASFPVWSALKDRGMIVTLAVTIVEEVTRNDLLPIKVSEHTSFHVDKLLDPLGAGMETFFVSLHKYAVVTGMMSKYQTLEITCNSRHQLTGPSSQLAILAALCGWSTHAVYSGEVTWNDVITPVLNPVGLTPEKTMLCLDAGRPLICYPDTEEAIDQILNIAESRQAEVLMEGQLIARVTHSQLCVFLVGTVAGATLASIFSAPVRAALAVVTVQEKEMHELKKNDKEAFRQKLQEQKRAAALRKGQTFTSIIFKDENQGDPPGYVEAQNELAALKVYLGGLPDYMSPIVASYRKRIGNIETVNTSTYKGKQAFIVAANTAVSKARATVDASIEKHKPKKARPKSRLLSLNQTQDWTDTTRPVSVPSKGKGKEEQSQRVQFENLEDVGDVASEEEGDDYAEIEDEEEEGGGPSGFDPDAVFS